jgi:hypothetical protein
MMLDDDSTSTSANNLIMNNKLDDGGSGVVVTKTIKNIKNELDNCKNFDESLHNKTNEDFDELLSNKSVSFFSMTTFDTTKNNETISFLSQSNLTPMSNAAANQQQWWSQQNPARNGLTSTRMGVSAFQSVSAEKSSHEMGNKREENGLKPSLDSSSTTGEV